MMLLVRNVAKSVAIEMAKVKEKSQSRNRANIFTPELRPALDPILPTLR